MEIKDINTFLEYFEKVRERTLKVIKVIPRDKINWTYKEGKFTFADIIRHLSTIERFMYAENAQFKPSRYPGHGKELAESYEEVMEFFNRSHSEAMNIFSKLTTEDLEKKCSTPAGITINFRIMIEANG